MRIITPPKDGGYYQRYRGFLKGLVPMSYLGQLVSFLTEVVPIAAILYGVSASTGITIPFSYCLTIGAILALVLEVSLRESITLAFVFIWEKKAPDSMTHEAKRIRKDKGLQQVDKPLRVSVIVKAVFLVIIQQALSFYGATQTVAMIAEDSKAIMVDTIAIRDSVSLFETIAANEKWKRDSLVIEQSFQREIETTEKLASTNAQAYTLEAEKYAAIDPVKYRSRIATARINAEKAASEQLTKLSGIESEKSDSLKAAYSRLNTALALAINNGVKKASERAGVITSKNNEIDQKTKKSGIKLAWFTVFGTIVLIITLYVKQGVMHGSKQSVRHKDSVLLNYPSVINEALRVFRERVTFNAFRKVYDYEAMTMEPPVPVSINERIDFTGTAKSESDTDIDVEQGTGKIVELPLKTSIPGIQEKPDTKERKTIGFKLAATSEGESRNTEDAIRNELLDSRNEALRKRNDTDQNTQQSHDKRVCACGCGRSLRGKRDDAIYFNNACRARSHRKI